MILTNKSNVTYDWEKIDRDFDVFLVTKPKELYKCNVLDLPTARFHALAVQYSFGKEALVLFRKNDITERAFRESIMSEYTDVKVQKLDLFNENTREDYFHYQSRLLLQLLANSMRVPTGKSFAYNNLTGRLYYFLRKNEKYGSATFLEVAFDPGMYLNLGVKTFRKGSNAKKERYYLFDSKSGCFRRALQEDNIPPEEMYAEGSLAHHRTVVEHLNFSSFDKFRACKLGVMERFLRHVKKYLGEYLTLAAEQRNGDSCYSETRKEKENLSGVDYGALLNERGVNIADECKTEISALIIERVIAELRQFYGITAQRGDLRESMYNIRLIHNDEYYDEHDEHDPHDDSLKGFIVQHMAVEDQSDLIGASGEKASPVIQKIVTELILKGDVHHNRISIYNWEKLCSEKVWTFVSRQKLGSEQGKSRKTTGESAGENARDHFGYVAVRIETDGSMLFRSFDDTVPPADHFEERTRYVFEKYAIDQRKARKEVEGLVFSDIENIHVIIRTRETTMPNTEAIWNALRETDAKDAVSTAVVLEAVASFREFHPEYEAFADRVADGLTEIPEPTKGSLKKLLNMRTKAGKQFNRFFHQQYGIRISPEIKDSDFSDDYMLGNITDIKYFEDAHTDGQDIRSFNYYAGPAGNQLQLSLKNACVVRQVQAEGELEFQELLPLMAVDFIRAGRYTVLPFPFKYLREYRGKAVIAK